MHLHVSAACHLHRPSRLNAPHWPTSSTRGNHRPMLRLQALQIIEGICRSLDHSHRNGCTHGDVQPEKIFVTAEGHVRLIGHRGAPTPAYASCEVLEGMPPVPADDLFSAACTGYQLLAGEPAFGHTTHLQAEAVARRPARIPHLSPNNGVHSTGHWPSGVQIVSRISRAFSTSCAVSTPVCPKMPRL